MQKIPLNLAAAEMVLARDIFKKRQSDRYADLRQGDCAFRFADHRLQQMGVQSLYVEGHPVWQEGDRCLSEQLAELEKRSPRRWIIVYNAVLLDIYRNHLTTAMGDNGGRTEE